MEEIKGKNLEELLREIENKYGVTKDKLSQALLL